MDRIDQNLDTKPSKPPSNDVFSDIITDTERETVLKAPTPIIVGAIESTLIESGNREIIRSVAQNSVALVTRGGIVPDIDQSFANNLMQEKGGGLAPYIGGSSRDYLGIFCGFINSMRNLNKKSPEEVQKISESFTQKAEEELKSSPDVEIGKAAAWIIAQNFKKEPLF